MDAAETRKVMEDYLGYRGTDMVAEDAVHAVTSAGETARGHDAVSAFLTNRYRTVFRAKAKLRTLEVSAERAAAQYEFEGEQS